MISIEHIPGIPVGILTEESACGRVILPGAEVISLRFRIPILAAVAERVIQLCGFARLVGRLVAEGVVVVVQQDAAVGA